MSEGISISLVGCGSRGRTYMRIAAALGYEIAAYADPKEDAREVMRQIVGDGAKAFASSEELFAQPRLSRVAAICTQDAQHFGHATSALEAGYDILLEKPAACTSEEVEKLAALAKEKDRRIILCFVLRYTPFFGALKREIDKGSIGEVMTIEAHEGVGPFHNVHSFVRGHWSKTTESSPMMVAKCSHDTDILSWFAGSAASTVASFENISHFKPEKMPEGATARCTDGCPHLGACAYDAHRYMGDCRNYLRMVRPDEADMTDEQILEWIKTTDWGRCAYQCDQDTPDHQVVSVQFENGVTASLTMTAFDTGRRIRVFGTTGMLEGAIHADGREPWIQCRPHEGEIRDIEIEEQQTGGYQGHGGGDYGLIAALPELLEAADQSDFVEGHRIAFAAAKASAEGRVIAF